VMLFAVMLICITLCVNAFMYTLMHNIIIRKRIIQNNLIYI
jgi:hypothetical protein